MKDYSNKEWINWHNIKPTTPTGWFLVGLLAASLIMLLIELVA